MRRSKAKKAKTHKRIVAVTSKRFREDGIAGIGIADLMKEAGILEIPPEAKTPLHSVPALPQLPQLHQLHQLHQQTTDVTIADLQPLGGFDLRDLLLPGLV